MKYLLKGLICLICFFSSADQSEAHISHSQPSTDQTKLYFNSNDLEISDNVISIHLENNLIETNVIRTDQQGLYIFDSDITNYEIAKEKKWKCPYCNRWWRIGEKCQNPNCPTNKW